MRGQSLSWDIIFKRNKAMSAQMDALINPPLIPENVRLLALWSWSKNHPQASFQEFQDAYYRCERLGSRHE